MYPSNNTRIQINLTCLYDTTARDESVAHVLHGLIAAFCTHTTSEMYLTGHSKREALEHVYTYEILANRLDTYKTAHRMTLFLWNGKERFDGAQIGINMLRHGGRIPSAFTAQFYGSMDSLFAFEPYMVRAIEALDASLSWVVDGDLLRKSISTQPGSRTPLGELVWLRGDKPHEIDGFKARNDGMGTLYRMERTLAEQDADARAALVATLRTKLALG